MSNKKKSTTIEESEGGVLDNLSVLEADLGNEISETNGDNTASSQENIVESKAPPSIPKKSQDPVLEEKQEESTVDKPLQVSMKPETAIRTHTKETVVIREESKKEEPMNIVAEDVGSMTDEQFRNLVTIRPVKLYKRNGSMQGVSVMPGAKKKLGPYEDRHGNLVTGHTPEECKKYSFIKVDMDFWRNYSMVLVDTEKILDISKEQDLLDYKFLKSHYWVANSPDEITTRTKYVMFNEGDEADKKVKVMQFEMEAMAVLNDMSEIQKSNFLKLYGDKTRTMKPTVVLSRLIDNARQDPKEFIRRSKDKHREQKILIISLEQFQIIKRDGLSYYYGDDLLGANLDMTVAYFETPKNGPLVAQFITMLEGKQRIA